MEENAPPAEVHDREEEEDEDDALSLSDLPMMSNDPLIDEVNPSTCRKILPRRSSSEPADFFEFLHTEDSNSTMMSHAEDIFFCGKLVPFDPYHEHDHLKKRQSFYRRRSESLPDPIINKPRVRGGVRTTEIRTEEEVIPLIRRKKLRRNFSSLSSSEKSSSLIIRSNNSSTKSKSSVKSEISTRSSINSSTSKPITTTSRWLFLIFGFVKPLPEMELSDIKSRQVRRGPTSIFPHFVDGKRKRAAEGKRRSSSSSSWGLLSVLSCRNHASVAVTTPFGCLPS
ncbi:uncharacterized protein LOC124925239 [Impatiens glandulifera]|uniref:uncharacterized protein LOC124925239 n=1 Tax=Impatiens glandulifera TaxID=253017 RepID=UPI001FB19848|nr:uncharacterized protein LOC124925239 [Impatiens glandulifera]